MILPFGNINTNIANNKSIFPVREDSIRSDYTPLIYSLSVIKNMNRGRILERVIRIPTIFTFCIFRRTSCWIFCSNRAHKFITYR
jgi:hypothetical protein